MQQIAIIGAGPAGLMAAEIIASAGHYVTVYDAMPTAGRKFLMAGRGGLNLTHSEPLDQFVKRYGAASAWLAPLIEKFPPSALQDWCHGLGQETFIGTSGRVFPKGLKASPLLRAWLHRLNGLGVRFVMQRKWMGWDRDNRLVFSAPHNKTENVNADATLLVLGGASWPKLGSDGSWVEILSRRRVLLSPLSPANCGFIAPWSDVFRRRFEGQPLKPVTLSFGGETIQGEAVITSDGIEGGVIYALSARLKEAIRTEGTATLALDLRPGLPLAELTRRLQAPRGSQSLSNHLRKTCDLPPAAIGLLYEGTPKEILQAASMEDLARIIKACPLRLTAPGAIDRAISTAGGISRSAMNQHFMLRNHPGLFAAGEMLDWEAPTGGYLLQATFSTSVAAANGLLAWLRK